MAGSSGDWQPACTRRLAAAVLLALLVSPLATCSVGHGSGELSGTVNIADCRDEGPYELSPTAFFGEAVQDFLSIRVQRGSDLVVLSDGLAVLVEDAALVKREFLGIPLSIGAPGQPVVDVSLYLNESCPAERDKTPIALSAIRGTITFSEIYAPRVDKSEVRIAAELTQVRFEDPRRSDRWAELSGGFDFLYVRGSPAQRFP